MQSPDIILTALGIKRGVWEGLLSGADTDVTLEVTHLGRPLEGVQILPGKDGGQVVRVPIPAESISDGVQTFLIRANATTLAHFTVIAGVAMEDDLRAEIDLMRAELDTLKRAFRRHCAETEGG